jgi:hypothetical protein
LVQSAEVDLFLVSHRCWNKKKKFFTKKDKSREEEEKREGTKVEAQNQKKVWRSQTTNFMKQYTDFITLLQRRTR